MLADRTDFSLFYLMFGKESSLPSPPIIAALSAATGELLAELQRKRINHVQSRQSIRHDANDDACRHLEEDIRRREE
jgi:hypothetical protein